MSNKHNLLVYVVVLLWTTQNKCKKKSFEWRGFEMVPYHLIFELRSNSMRGIQLLNSQILHYIANIMPYGSICNMYNEHIWYLTIITTILWIFDVKHSYEFACFANKMDYMIQIPLFGIFTCFFRTLAVLFVYHGILSFFLHFFTFQFVSLKERIL